MVSQPNHSRHPIPHFRIIYPGKSIRPSHYSQSSLPMRNCRAMQSGGGDHSAPGRIVILTIPASLIDTVRLSILIDLVVLERLRSMATAAVFLDILVWAGLREWVICRYRPDCPEQRPKNQHQKTKLPRNNKTAAKTKRKNGNRLS